MSGMRLQMLVWPTTHNTGQEQAADYKSQIQSRAKKRLLVFAI